jgi:hypothetical protein
MGLFIFFKKNGAVKPTDAPKPLPVDKFDTSLYVGFHQPEYKL